MALTLRTGCGRGGTRGSDATSASPRTSGAVRAQALRTASRGRARSQLHRTKSWRGSVSSPLRSAVVVESGPWMDYVKFRGSTPNFDVVAKTKEYTATAGYRSFRLRDVPKEYFAEDYVFRGPIVGPFTRKDLVETNTNFGVDSAFPDLDRETFGHCVDPENPYRCLFFERWKATHTGDLRLPGLPPIPATGRTSTSPVFPFSVVWNPDGQIVYEHLTTAVDRFEGNTMGKVAVFGLLHTAGLPLDTSVGNGVLAAAQKLNRWLDRPVQTYSKKEDVPAWWKSTVVGADPNDI